MLHHKHVVNSNRCVIIYSHGLDVSNADSWQHSLTSSAANQLLEGLLVVLLVHLKSGQTDSISKLMITEEDSDEFSDISALINSEFDVKKKTCYEKNIYKMHDLYCNKNYCTQYFHLVFFFKYKYLNIYIQYNWNCKQKNSDVWFWWSK